MTDSLFLSPLSPACGGFSSESARQTSRAWDILPPAEAASFARSFYHFMKPNAKIRRIDLAKLAWQLITFNNETHVSCDAASPFFPVLAAQFVTEPMRLVVQSRSSSGAVRLKAHLFELFLVWHSCTGGES